MRKGSRFEQLFLPHLDAAYSLARWIVGRDQDAQDIVQEAYARALKGFSGFRGDNPRAWLLTIVRNTGYSWIKKHLNEEKLLIPFDEETHAVPVEVVPSELSQERRRQLLAEALNRLPAKFSEVLVLFEIERCSYRAIATALNVRLGTVMSRLNRARCRLQQELTQVLDREIEEELLGSTDEDWRRFFEINVLCVRKRSQPSNCGHGIGLAGTRFQNRSLF
jgi:RNA polymerase sigma-70 factor, ECF subfamily